MNFVYSGKMGFWPAQTFSTEAQKNGPSLGFHGGLGIDYAFFRKWSFFVEAQGRVAKFAGFEGQTDCWAVDAQVFPPFYEQGSSPIRALPRSPALPGSSWSRARRGRARRSASGGGRRLQRLQSSGWHPNLFLAARQSILQLGRRLPGNSGRARYWARIRSTFCSG